MESTLESETRESSLQFSWKSLECGKVNGDFRCYRYKLTEKASGDILYQTCSTDRHDHNVTFRQLTPCTVYTFQIRSQNRGGRYSPWAILEVQTHTAGRLFWKRKGFLIPRISLRNWFLHYDFKDWSLCYRHVHKTNRRKPCRKPFALSFNEDCLVTEVRPLRSVAREDKT